MRGGHPIIHVAPFIGECRKNTVDMSKNSTLQIIINGNCYISRGHNYPIWCVAESSTGLYVATGSRDSTARLWSTDREFPLQTYIGHTQDVDVGDQLTE